MKKNSSLFIYALLHNVIIFILLNFNFFIILITFVFLVKKKKIKSAKQQVFFNKKKLGIKKILKKYEIKINNNIYH